MSEAGVILRAKEGELGAWEQIVAEHQGSVFRLAYLFLGDEAEAKDLAQEVFMRAMRHIQSVDPGRPLRPWLLRITSNLAKNRLRSIARYVRALQRYARLRETHDQGDLQGDDQRMLWEATKELSAQHRQVVYLHYFLEVSVAEIAEALEIPPGTVKSRLHRARRQLKDMLKSELGYESEPA